MCMNYFGRDSTTRRRAVHKRAYQHRVSNAIERMLCDVLSGRKKQGFMYRGKKLSEAMDCLDAYATLTDSVV